MRHDGQVADKANGCHSPENSKDTGLVHSFKFTLSTTPMRAKIYKIIILTLIFKSRQAGNENCKASRFDIAGEVLELIG